MPVLVNYNKCNCAPNCFASSACPNDALHVDKTALRVWVEPQKCGECPGKCLNFCDSVALKFAPTLQELAIVQQELDGELTREQAIEARAKMAQEMKALAEAEVAKDAAVVVKPMTLTTANFVQEVAHSELPVFVDFWAEWCGPCKQIGPIVEQFANDYAGRMKFAKLNVDEEPQVAAQFQVQSIPTMFIFFGGQVADVIVGALDKRSLQARVERVLTAVDQLNAQRNGQPVAPKPAPVPAPAVRPTLRPSVNPKLSPRRPKQ